jgi:hypothetical protein
MTLSVVLIDLTTDATPAALRPTKEFRQALAQALNEQVQGPFAAEYGKQDVTFSVLDSQDQRQSTDVAMNFRDTLDVEGALAYHVDNNGVPDMEVGVDYCSSLGDEGESISGAASHETLELLVDPGCNLWADTGEGFMRPKEASDTVQNTGYRASNGLWMSNFLRASAWIPGAPGPWDFLGVMKAQDDYSNGYEVRASPPTDETQVQGGAEAAPPPTRAPKLGESVGHLLGSVFAVGSLTESQTKHKRSRYSRTHRRGVRL